MTIVHGVFGTAVPSDRAGSRQLARRHLEHGLRWLGMPMPVGEPARGATGRPHFIGAGFDYSCSHDRGAVAVATSTGRVGIDVVANRVATPHIWSFLYARRPRARARHAHGLGRLRPEHEALVLWTRFEAEVKFRGGSVWQEWVSVTSGRPVAPSAGYPEPQAVHSWTIRDGRSEAFLSVATEEDEPPPLDLRHSNGAELEVYPVAVSEEPATCTAHPTETESRAR